VNVVDICRAHHHQADAHEAGGQRNQEPIADVGDDLALVPPRAAGIAGRPVRQHREHDAERDRYRDDLEDGRACDQQHGIHFDEHSQRPY